MAQVRAKCVPSAVDAGVSSRSPMLQPQSWNWQSVPSRSYVQVSQSRSMQPVVAASQGSAQPLQAVSAPREALPENEVDVLRKTGFEGLLKLVMNPPPLEEDDEQAELVLVDRDRKQIPKNQIPALLTPNAVILHIYNLNEAFVGANEALALNTDRAAVGGAFHAGVEVYGSEWSYGIYGVACIPPRSETAHVYQCSVIMGTTSKDQKAFTTVLFDMLRHWLGADYDILAQNCCSFASKLGEELGLGVEAMPEWVDRLPRALHAGREAGRQALGGVGEVGRQAQILTVQGHRQAVELARAAQPHVERAARQASVAIVQANDAVDHHATVAGQAIHHYATTEVPRMVEAARPHVERAAREALVQGQIAADVTRDAVFQAADASQELYVSVRPHVQRAAVQTWHTTATGFNDLGRQAADGFN